MLSMGSLNDQWAIMKTFIKGIFIVRILFDLILKPVKDQRSNADMLTRHGQKLILHFLPTCLLH